MDILAGSDGYAFPVRAFQGYAGLRAEALLVEVPAANRSTLQCLRHLPNAIAPLTDHSTKHRP